MNKRIILVGPTASGKNFIRDQFFNKGYSIDCSYTTRKPREGETDKADYNFLSEKEFRNMIHDDLFYEWTKYGDNHYGTGLWEWDNRDIFIMETDGVSKIKPDDREECLVIFVNTSYETRMVRMVNRDWDKRKILGRTVTDKVNFGDFTDFDIQIKSE